MPTISLPADPTVGHFRRLARRLQRAVRAGDPEAAALAARYGFPARLPALGRTARGRPGVRLQLLAGAAPAAGTARRLPPRPGRGAGRRRPGRRLLPARLPGLLGRGRPGPVGGRGGVAGRASRPADQVGGGGRCRRRSGRAGQPATWPTRPLARLLLEAGADPNDGQALYNRMFVPGDDAPGAAVRVRARAGEVRRLAGAPRRRAWRRRPRCWPGRSPGPRRTASPTGSGCSCGTPWTRTPVSPEGRALPLAAAAGHREIAELLLAAGAEPVELSPVDGLVAAVLAGDGAGVDPAVLPAALAEPARAGRRGGRRRRRPRARGTSRLRRLRPARGPDRAAHRGLERRPGPGRPAGRRSVPTSTRGTTGTTGGRSTGPATPMRTSDVVSFLAEAAEAAAERSADAGRAETAEAAAAARVRGGPGRGSRPAGTAP